MLSAILAAVSGTAFYGILYSCTYACKTSQKVVDDISTLLELYNATSVQVGVAQPQITKAVEFAQGAIESLTGMCKVILDAESASMRSAIYAIVFLIGDILVAAYWMKYTSTKCMFVVL